MFDILATDAATKLVHHLEFWSVDPNALDDGNFSKPVIQQDPTVVLNQFLQGEGFRLFCLTCQNGLDGF
ncbi:hypothetical protein [Ruegeria sp. Alg231-54]|uniref:hypothetical protein n=1 Tax=Ruegeria sp. Alg231-54 TaxID=1922221 RepID=UPI001F167870|nr:hypothetical protein [Ruegeria sp. Alg231-54]